MNETFHPSQPAIATSRDADAPTVSRNQLVPNDIETLSMVIVSNTKRNESNKRAMLEDNEADAKRRKEISEKADSSHDFVEHTSAPNDREYLSIDEIEIGPEILNITNFKVSYDILPNIQEDSAPAIISDSGITTGGRLNFMDSILSTPGPSGFRENEDLYQLSPEKLHSSNLSDRDSLWLKYQKTFTCRVCKKKIDEHSSKGKGKKCCVCEYKTDTMYDLHMHSRHHCAKTVCDICSKHYTEGDPHEREQTCIVCKETFECETMLNQHVVVHEEHFVTHCWGCNICIRDHFIKNEGKYLYFCCICKFEDYNECNLKSHNHSHRTVTCEICKEKYPKMESGRHSKECECIVCGEKFNCKTLLEDHLKNHDEHFETFCRLCNQEKEFYHKINTEEKNSYKCCNCQKEWNRKYLFRCHIFSHIELKLFKCVVCDKRYGSTNGLKKHLETKCISLPEKCEICLARFPCSLSLYLHSLEKHRQTGEEISA